MDFREINEFFRDTFKYIVVAVVVILVFVFVIGLQQVVGPSMSPTLTENDIVVINKLSYKLHKINRGDVVIASVSDKYMIKRVIGLPGDELKIVNGRIYLNGVLFDDYVDIDIEESGNLEKGIKVNDNEYFIIGDNRNDSEDSRFYGAVSKKNIVGKVAFRIYPFSKMGRIK